MVVHAAAAEMQRRPQAEAVVPKQIGAAEQILEMNQRREYDVLVFLLVGGTDPQQRQQEQNRDDESDHPIGANWVLHGLPIRTRNRIGLGFIEQTSIRETMTPYDDRHSAIGRHRCAAIGEWEGGRLGDFRNRVITPLRCGRIGRTRASRDDGV